MLFEPGLGIDQEVIEDNLMITLEGISGNIAVTVLNITDFSSGGFKVNVTTADEVRTPTLTVSFVDYTAIATESGAYVEAKDYSF